MTKHVNVIARHEAIQKQVGASGLLRRLAMTGNIHNS